MSRALLWIQLIAPMILILLFPIVALAAQMPPVIDPPTDLISQALQSGVWVLVVWAVIWLGVYGIKIFMPYIWNKIPKKFQPFAVASLGILSAIAQAIIMKQLWLPILIQNLFAALGAIGSDQILSKLGITPEPTQAQAPREPQNKE